MKKLWASLRMVLLLPMVAVGVSRTSGQGVRQAAPAIAAEQAVPAFEDIKSQAELDKAVAALDAALFDSYNRCELEKFASFFAEDVEFYHDQGGVTLGRAALTDSVKKNICGKVTRELHDD